MRARLYICDVCGCVEDKQHGGAFYIFKYTERVIGWNQRRKMVMCNECFHNMLAFCENGEEIEYEESEADEENESEANEDDTQ